MTRLLSIGYRRLYTITLAHLQHRDIPHINLSNNLRDIRMKRMSVERNSSIQSLRGMTQGYTSFFI